MNTTEHIPTMNSEDSSLALDTDTFGAQLMIALEKMFRIGSYYPPEHQRCVEVAEDFRSELTEILKRSFTLQIDMVGDILLMQQSPLPGHMSGVASFTEMLDHLGVSRVEIDANVSNADMYCFVALLVSYRNRIVSSRRFQQFEIEGLPSTIRVCYREFIVDECPFPPDSPLFKQIEDLANDYLPILEQDSLGPEQLPAFNARVDESLQLATKGVSPETLAIAAKDATTKRPVGSPKTTNIAGVKQASSKTIPAQKELRTLINLFQPGGGKQQNSEVQTSVDLLFRLLSRVESQYESESDHNYDYATKQTDNQASESDAALIEYELTLDELYETIDCQMAEAETIDSLDIGDRREQLSVLVQLAQGDISPRGLTRLRHDLQEYLAKKITAEERTILVHGLADLARLFDETRRKFSLATTMQACRKAPGESVFELALEIWDTLSSTEQLHLWPHIINELFMDPAAAKTKPYRELARRVAHIPDQDMTEAIACLESLEAVVKRNAARDLMSTPVPDLLPILGKLVGLSDSLPIGNLLVAQLKLSPPCWVAKAVMPLVTSFSLDYKQYYRELITHDDVKVPSPIIHETTGRLLAKKLPKLPRERRKEPWVINAVKAIAKFMPEDVMPVLQAIEKERHNLIFPAWPAACRREAGKIRKKVQHKYKKSKPGRKR